MQKQIQLQFSRLPTIISWCFWRHLLKSIDMNHQSDEHINFYIVGDNLTHKNKANLEKCT